MKTCTKPEAARLLIDDILDLKEQLERAELLMQDIGTDYFGRHFDFKEQQACYLSFDYNRYNVLSNIVMDYLFNLRQKLQDLESLARESEADHA